MPRDIHGHSKRPEGSKAAEPMKAGASGDKDSVPKMSASAKDPDDIGDLRAHHDRLTRIEEHLGMAKPKDGFTAEAQSKSKDGAEKPTVKATPREKSKEHEKERSGEPSYHRKRH